MTVIKLRYAVAIAVMTAVSPISGCRGEGGADRNRTVEAAPHSPALSGTNDEDVPLARLTADTLTQGDGRTTNVLLVAPVSLGTGEIGTYEVEVSSCDSLVVSVATATGRASLSVTDPLGASVNSTHAAGGAVGPAGGVGEGSSGLSVGDPIPGRWLVNLIADAPAMGGLSVFEYGGPSVELTHPQWVSPGSVQTIEVAISMDRHRVLGASARAVVVGASDVRNELMLLDNGAVSDRVAGDGVYSGSVNVGAEEGQRAIHVWVTAALPDGRCLNRVAEGEFEVATFVDAAFGEPAIVIRGPDADGGFLVETTVQNNGDGTADEIVARIYDNSGITDQLTNGRLLSRESLLDMAPGEARTLRARLYPREGSDSVVVCVQLSVIGQRSERVRENNRRCVTAIF